MESRILEGNTHLTLSWALSLLMAYHHCQTSISSAPGKYDCVIFKHISMIAICSMCMSCKITVTPPWGKCHRASLDGSKLAQIMAWCHQAPSHYLNQCWQLWCHMMSPCHNEITPSGTKPLTEPMLANEMPHDITSPWWDNSQGIVMHIFIRQMAPHWPG